MQGLRSAWWKQTSSSWLCRRNCPVYLSFKKCLKGHQRTFSYSTFPDTVKQESAKALSCCTKSKADLIKELKGIIYCFWELKKKGQREKLIKRFSCELQRPHNVWITRRTRLWIWRRRWTVTFFKETNKWWEFFKKKLVFELLETVKRLTETNMSAGNLKDPNGNTRISFFVT